MKTNKADYLKAGVQFGHLKKNCSPMMKKFIFPSKKRVDVIDINKIVESSESISDFVERISSKGEEILFVGVKKQTSELVKNAAIKCGSPYVVKRWIGGFLTNFEIISKEIYKFSKLKSFSESDEFSNITKKEQAETMKIIKKKEDCYGGVLNLKKIPNYIFIVGLKAAYTAFKEAKKIGIKVIAICNTNVDPTFVDYVILGNDDKVNSVGFFSEKISDSINEGKRSNSKNVEENHQKKREENHKEYENDYSDDDSNI